MGTSDGGMIRQEKGMMMMNANNSRRPVDKTSMPLTSETSAQDAAWREARDELPASCRRESRYNFIDQDGLYAKLPQHVQPLTTPQKGLFLKRDGHAGQLINGAGLKRPLEDVHSAAASHKIRRIGDDLTPSQTPLPPPQRPAPPTAALVPSESTAAAPPSPLRLRLRDLICRAPPKPPPLPHPLSYYAFFESWSTELSWVTSSHEILITEGQEVRNRSSPSTVTRRIVSPNKITAPLASPHPVHPSAREPSAKMIPQTPSQSKMSPIAEVDDARALIERMREAALIEWDDITEPLEQAYHLHPADVDDDRNILFNPEDARVDDPVSIDGALVGEFKTVSWRTVGLLDEEGRGLRGLPTAWMAREWAIADEGADDDAEIPFGFERMRLALSRAEKEVGAAV